jgi:hypothetical protein
MKQVNQWCILPYIFLIPLFLIIPITLTVTDILSVWLFEFRIGQINLGAFGTPPTSHWSGLFTTLMPPSSLSIWLSQSPYLPSQLLVLEMLLGVQSSSLSTRLELSPQIQRTFNIWVHTSGCFFVDQAGSKGDLSDHFNAAAPSYWNSDQDTLTSSSMSEMNAAAVICLCWARDSFCVVHRF